MDREKRLDSDLSACVVLCVCGLLFACIALIELWVLVCWMGEWIQRQKRANATQKITSVIQAHLPKLLPGLSHGSEHELCATGSQECYTQTGKPIQAATTQPRRSRATGWLAGRRGWPFCHEHAEPACLTPHSCQSPPPPPPAASKLHYSVQEMDVAVLRRAQLVAQHNNERKKPHTRQLLHNTQTTTA